jgi:hypothetical protein
MWTPVDLFLKAKTSVPVLLYTTEQMFVAHFFVQAFRWWTRRLDKRRDWEEAAGDRQQSHASPSEVAQSEVKSSDMRESQTGNANAP